MNFELKVELLRRFGSQIIAARHLKISESRLSHLIRGHAQPSERERKAMERVLGQGRVAELLKGPAESSEQAGAI